MIPWRTTVILNQRQRWILPSHTPKWGLTNTPPKQTHLTKEGPFKSVTLNPKFTHTAHPHWAGSALCAHAPSAHSLYRELCSFHGQHLSENHGPGDRRGHQLRERDSGSVLQNLLSTQKWGGSGGCWKCGFCWLPSSTAQLSNTDKSQSRGICIPGRGLHSAAGPFSFYPINISSKMSSQALLVQGKRKEAWDKVKKINEAQSAGWGS